VKHVLENPSREAREKLAKASECTQATREINSNDPISRNSDERSNNVALAGVGPVGLYYFFSPNDPSAATDVAVLNKIWRDGRIGIVGIRVRGSDEELVKFVNESRPLFRLE
jgi:hypothetical protein